MWLLGCSFLLWAIVAATNSNGPQFLLEQGSYHGLIRENETVVEVTPEIRANSTYGICEFKIVGKHWDAPFNVTIRTADAFEAHAQLTTRHALNCESRDSYKFDIVAVDCRYVHSSRLTVHIKVVDVNEYTPTFREPAYVRQILEGRNNNTEIVRVEATDLDCSPKFGDICKYEIVERDQPFVIDDDGVVRNTEPLLYAQSHNYILSVIAFDCGMRQSLPVLVTVTVCRLGWHHLPDHIDYVPDGGKLTYLFPEATLDLCDTIFGTVRQYAVGVELEARLMAEGCDRDTYSVDAQRKLCGASAHAHNLLPSNTPWTRHMRNEGFTYLFDGSAVTVPEHVIRHDLPLKKFTVSTWMRHKLHHTVDKRRKEHILCLADDHRMNRHHLAVFLRNGRLILLMRREATDGNQNIFQPAEWRWKLPSDDVDIVDSWHHYAINVNLPATVDLYLDGVRQGPPEVIDDWPLHPTKGINTTLMVGACWQGSENRTKHNLYGSLAGLSLLIDSNEPERVFKCLRGCQESLQLPPVDLLQPGMELLTNTERTEVTITGPNRTNIENLIRHVTYQNVRQFPTPGRRNLRITTNITCADNTERTLRSNSYLSVLPAPIPTIHLNGTQNLSRQYDDYRLGVRIFADLRIGNHRKLDKCTVTVSPSLVVDKESIELPEGLLKRFGLAASISNYGAVITGSDMTYNYQEVLRHIDYTNRNPAFYSSRLFKLVCSELNGRFTSNEYVQTLTVVGQHHPKAADEVAVGKVVAAHATIHRHVVDVDAQPHYMKHEKLMSSMTGMGGSHAVTVIVVICVGFLLFMMVLGVVRIRSAHHYYTLSNRKGHLPPHHHRQFQGGGDGGLEGEMTWDDSGLSITVNPMEGADARLEKGDGPMPHHSTQNLDDLTSSDDDVDDDDDDECPMPNTSSEDDDDDYDYIDDDDDDIDIDMQQTSPVKRKRDYQTVNQLEWDHSNI